MNDTTPTVRTFAKEVGSQKFTREGYGCPCCGHDQFSRVQNCVQYVSETCYGGWTDDGDHEIDDYGDTEYHDSEFQDWETGFECNECGHEYDESEADLSQVDWDEDDEVACLRSCDDYECEGDCRTDADWPFLADHGVQQHEAVGALLAQHAPHAVSFTWEERLGFTVIGIKPSKRGGGYPEYEPHSTCPTCDGDMTTEYTRTITLPHKQTRYPLSSKDEIHGTRDVALQLQIPICYVCHQGD